MATKRKLEEVQQLRVQLAKEKEKNKPKCPECGSRSLRTMGSYNSFDTTNYEMECNQCCHYFELTLNELSQ